MRVRSFDKIAEERQIEFRKTSPTITEQGRSPSDDKGRQYDYMLALGCEDENLYRPLRGDNGARKFFSDRRLTWWSHNGFDAPRKNGPTRNMKSSQPMCVNFLLPLSEIGGALETVVRAIDCDVEHIVGIFHEDRVSHVEFEWIGVPLSLEGRRGPRGQLNTSVDAFVIAETSGGRRRAYLIEWKYRETSSTEDFGAGSKGETRREIYSDLYHAPSSSFSHKVPMNALLYGDLYQLMRNRLLADRMVAEGELDVSDAKVVLVIPEGNSAYLQPPYLRDRFPEMGTTVPEVFRATLKDPDRAFATVSPSLLLNAVEKECGETVSAWAAYLRDRYGL